MRDEPSRTAEYVCLCRAAERRRPERERVLDDPYAEWFLSALPRGMLGGLRYRSPWWRGVADRAPGIFSYVAVRHRFIDDALLEELAGPLDQVVILGAGYDSRAYRFASQLDGRPVFELDFPTTSRRKQQIVKRRAADLPDTDVRHVEIDFLRERIDDRLGKAGFQSGGRSFFVWEGVSMYLSRQAVKETLRVVAALGARGTRLAMDLWCCPDRPDLAGTVQRTLPNLLHVFGEPMGMSLHPEDTPGFFDREGLELIDAADATELERRYLPRGRRVYPDFHLALARTL